MVTILAGTAAVVAAMVALWLVSRLADVSIVDVWWAPARRRPGRLADPGRRRWWARLATRRACADLGDAGAAAPATHPSLAWRVGRGPSLRGDAPRAGAARPPHRTVSACRACWMRIIRPAAARHRRGRIGAWLARAGATRRRLGARSRICSRAVSAYAQQRRRSRYRLWRGRTRTTSARSRCGGALSSRSRAPALVDDRLALIALSFRAGVGHSLLETAWRGAGRACGVRRAHERCLHPDAARVTRGESTVRARSLPATPVDASSAIVRRTSTDGNARDRSFGGAVMDGGRAGACGPRRYRAHDRSRTSPRRRRRSRGR